MSNFTVQVRFICESFAGYKTSTGFKQVDEIVEGASKLIFDPNIPFWKEEYRLPLEKLILKHYYTREIGEETVGLWVHRLNTRMAEIMPYYNKLYESADFKFNPLIDTDYWRTHEGTSEGDSNGTTTGTARNNYTDKFAETPQGGLSDLANDRYLTSASMHNGTNSDESSSTNHSENANEFREHISGKMGQKSYAKLVQEYRETLLKIDALVIGELSDLFLNLWE